ncbi:MAG: hypothetical protein R3326_04745 [Gemmatimonadota bacterium]|nr:hypothetical protein [Gemmatimonadota bacterium]
MIEISAEPPAHGATGVVWVSIEPGSSSLLDVRGLVLWPGTALVVAGDAQVRPGDAADPRIGDTVRAVVSDEEYWWIPPIHDARRIEIFRD